MPKLNKKGFENCRLIFHILYFRTTRIWKQKSTEFCISERIFKQVTFKRNWNSNEQISFIFHVHIKFSQDFRFGSILVLYFWSLRMLYAQSWLVLFLLAKFVSTSLSLCFFLYFSLSLSLSLSFYLYLSLSLYLTPSFLLTLIIFYYLHLSLLPFSLSLSLLLSSKLKFIAWVCN